MFSQLDGLPPLPGTARDVEAGEPRPLSREPVDVRRLDVLRAVSTQIAVAKIIGHDEDDVGLGSFGGRGSD